MEGSFEDSCWPPISHKICTSALRVVFVWEDFLLHDQWIYFFCVGGLLQIFVIRMIIINQIEQIE